MKKQAYILTLITLFSVFSLSSCVKEYDDPAKAKYNATLSSLGLDYKVNNDEKTFYYKNGTSIVSFIVTTSPKEGYEMFDDYALDFTFDVSGTSYEQTISVGSDGNSNTSVSIPVIFGYNFELSYKLTSVTGTYYLTTGDQELNTGYYPNDYCYTDYNNYRYIIEYNNKGLGYYRMDYSKDAIFAKFDEREQQNTNFFGIGQSLGSSLYLQDHIVCKNGTKLPVMLVVDNISHNPNETLETMVLDGTFTAYELSEFFYNAYHYFPNLKTVYVKEMIEVSYKTVFIEPKTCGTMRFAGNTKFYIGNYDEANSLDTITGGEFCDGQDFNITKNMQSNERGILFNFSALIYLIPIIAIVVILVIFLIRKIKNK